jgi:hypothetical protein
LAVAIGGRLDGRDATRPGIQIRHLNA